MAKLARVFDVCWKVGKSLDQIFADPTGMKRRATARKNDTADIAQLGRCHVQATQLCSAFIRVETATHRVAHRVWLLKDFFEHVMGIITFSNVFGGKLNLADRMLGAVPRKRRDLEFVSPCRDYIEIVQVNCVAGVSDDCANVAGQEIFAVTYAKHKRASPPRADHEIRDIGMDQSNAIRADHLAKRRANGCKQARFFFRDIHGAGA